VLVPDAEPASAEVTVCVAETTWPTGEDPAPPPPEDPPAAAGAPAETACVTAGIAGALEDAGVPVDGAALAEAGALEVAGGLEDAGALEGAGALEDAGALEGGEPASAEVTDCAAEATGLTGEDAAPPPPEDPPVATWAPVETT